MVRILHAALRELGAQQLVDMAVQMESMALFQRLGFVADLVAADWRQTFGFGYDSLTRSEARYLENSPDAHAIRNRLIAGGLESCGLSPEATAEPLIESEPARHSDHPKPVPTPKPRS